MRSTFVRSAFATIICAVLFGLLAAAPWPVSAQEAATSPMDWDCSTADFIPENSSDTLNGRPVKMQPDARGKWVPVLFVHGFTSTIAGEKGAFSSKMDLMTSQLGKAAGDRSLIGQLQTIPGAATFGFDYHDTSARWVDDDANGPALGTAIDCLFDKSGGEKVIVVAHSMGGLMTRFALGEDRKRVDRVSSVITFGTPNTGSDVARNMDVASVPIRLFLAACGRQTTISLENAGGCDNAVGTFTSEAGLALQTGSPQLRSLASWPAGVSVTALAGDIQLDLTQRSWFGVPVSSASVPFGDVVVSLDSAKAGATKAVSGQCRYQGNVVAAAHDQLLYKIGVTGANEIGQRGDMVSGACYHNNLMRNVELTNEATSVVDDDIASRAGLTVTPAGGETYAAADGYQPVIVVMDTSGSMAESDSSGTKRIDAARASVLEYVKSLPPGTPFGLIAYPGTGKVVDGCSIGTVEILPGPLDVVSTSAAVRRLSPNGETPTSPALKHAAEKLRSMGKQGTIILVSDGESNCGSTPVCDTARELSASGIEVRVNTVGFEIEEKGRGELRCVADVTGGRYLDAQDTSQLRDALSSATGARIELQTSIPESLPRVSGTGDGGTTIAVTVRNDSEIRADDVRVSLDFKDGKGTPGALQVPRPVRFLGNIMAGETRTTEFTVRPDASLNGTFQWVLTASARNADPQLEMGDTTLQDPFGRMTGLLGTARSIAVVGDSYASGEGIGSYQSGTDGDGNRCHRSDESFGPLLANLKHTSLIACSGAVTANFYDQQRSDGAKMPPQLQELRNLATGESSPDAVLVSIGGNDVGFGDEVTRCILLAVCEAFSPPRNEVLRAATEGVGLTSRLDRIAEVGNDLRRVYRDINRAVNDDTARAARAGKFAPVVVVPYPRITPADPIATGDSDPYSNCMLGIESFEIRYFNNFVDALNGQISSAVSTLQQEHIPVYYAKDVVTAFQPNHTVCDGTVSYAVTASDGAGLGARLTGITDKHELLHPNRDGHKAVARAISAWASSTAEITNPTAPEWEAATSTRLNNFWANGAQFLWPFSATDLYLAGGEAQIDADGFAPDSTVVFRLESVPRVVGFAKADENGRVEATVYLPDDVSPGPHGVHALGMDPSGAPHEFVVGVRVVGPYSMVALVSAVVGVVLVIVGAQSVRKTRRASVAVPKLPVE